MESPRIEKYLSNNKYTREMYQGDCKNVQLNIVIFSKEYGSCDWIVYTCTDKVKWPKTSVGPWVDNVMNRWADISETQ